MAFPTATGSTISPSPILLFETVPQAVTCNPLQITWLYSGPATTINLFVTNVGVSQDLPPPSTSSSSTRRNTFTNHGQHLRRAIPTGASDPLNEITFSIATNVNPFSLSLSWQSVNVTQGWYNIGAVMASSFYQTNSDSFFVRTGTDTSCIGEVTSTTDTAPSSTSNPSPSISPSLVVAIGGAKSRSLAMIVGICIGVFVIVMMVLVAWWFLLKKAKEKAVITSTKGSRGSKGNRHNSKPSARWNGLSSTDSRRFDSSTKKNFPSPHYQTHSSSKATIPVNASQEVLSAEKNSTYSDPFNGPAVALSTMPVLQQAFRSKVGSRTYSASSSTLNGFGGTNEFVAPPAPVRRPSVPDSVLGRQSIDSTNSNTYPPSPVSPYDGRSGRNSTQFASVTVSRSHSMSATSQTHQASSYSPSQSPSSYGPLHQSQLSNSTPFSPSHVNYDVGTVVLSPAKQANRQSVTGKKRKPVPAYDPNESSPPSPLPYGHGQSSSPVSPSSPSPVPDQVSVNGSVGGHYGTRSQVGQDSSQPNLSHKSSFGPGGIEGKPLHYLIPDMPMPQRD